MQAALRRGEIGTKFRGLTLGKVYKIHPEANMVDIMLFNGSILTHVQVLSSYASSRSGIVNLPKSKYKTNMLKRELQLSSAEQNEVDVIAVVGFLGGSVIRPIVLGFLFPEENELLCSGEQEGNEDGTMFLWKHDSNIYVRMAKGSTGKSSELEISHPSGLFIKIGNSTELTEINNYDKNIRPFKKLDSESDSEGSEPYIHFSHPSGSFVTVEPNGKIIIDSAENVEVNSAENVEVTATGECKIKGTMVKLNPSS